MHVPLPLLICLAGKAARKSSSLEIRSYVYPQFRLLFFIACAARKEKGIFNISPVFFASLHRAVMKMLFMSWHSHAQHLLKEQGGQKNARRQTQLGTSSPFFEDVQVGSLKVHSFIPKVQKPLLNPF